MNRSLPPKGDLTPYQEPSRPVPYAVYVEDEQELDLNIRSIWSFLRRNAWIVLAGVIVGGAVAYWYNHRATPIYRATTSLRFLNASSGEGPSAEELGLSSLRTDDQIETHLAVLQSRALAERTAISLGLQVVVLAPEGVGYVKELFDEIRVSEEAKKGLYRLSSGGSGFVVHSADGSRLASSPIGEPLRFNGVEIVPAREASKHSEILFRVIDPVAAAHRVRRRVNVYRPNKEQDIVMIAATGPHPVLTADLANALAESFLDHRRSERKSAATNTVEFLRAQIDTISSQLRLAEEDLKEFKQDQEVVNLMAEGQSGMSQIASLQGQLDAIESERVSLDAALDDIRESEATDPLAPSPARRLLGTPAILRNEAASQMLNTLIDLENERAELLQRRTPQDPDVGAINDRIRGVEDQLFNIVSSYEENLDRQVQSLQSSIGRTGSELRELPEKEVQFARRQRETSLLQEMYTLLQTKMKEAQIAQAVEDPNVRVVDSALVPGSPIAPDKRRNLMLGLLVGLVLGVGAAFGREYLDDTVHSMDEMEELTGVPVLGMIPTIPQAQLTNGRRRMLPSKSGANGGGRGKVDHSARLVVNNETKHAVAEAFRSLRTNITFSAAEKATKTILLTSPTAGDGKTTSAVNLAAAFAQQGLGVVVVDADLRRGLLHKIFGLSKTPGLSNYLVEGLAVSEVLQRMELDGTTIVHAITTGRYPPNPAELLSSPRMIGLLERLQEHFDMVVIDSPPLTMVTDSAVLAQHVDSVLLVARAGKTEEAAIQFSVRQLHNVGAPFKGTILNDVSSTDRRYGSYGYYAYKYEYYGTEVEPDDEA